jgi:hypothetical protein
MDRTDRAAILRRIAFWRMLRESPWWDIAYFMLRHERRKLTRLSFRPRRRITVRKRVPVKAVAVHWGWKAYAAVIALGFGMVFIGP